MCQIHLIHLIHLPNTTHGCALVGWAGRVRRKELVMSSHAAMPTGRFRRHRRAQPTPPVRSAHRVQGVVPVTLGLLYGIYVAFADRDHDPLTGGNILLGVVCGVVLAGLCFLLGRTQSRMVRELRAAAYGSLFGVATGFLISLSHASVLKASALGAVLGAAMMLVTFYIFYTRE